MSTVRKSKQSPVARRLSRARRRDGDATQAHLLETAGQVFAEFGYSATSAKLASERAGLNPAVVNYYFGSKEGLYEAVLKEAQRRVMDSQAIALRSAEAKGGGDPRELFARNLGYMIEKTLTSPEDVWVNKVLIREMTSPTPLTMDMAKRITEPVVLPMHSLIGQIIGKPARHPLTQRAFAAALGAIGTFMLFSPLLQNKLTPAIRSDARATANVIVRFVMAGLEEIRASNARETARTRRRKTRATA